MALFQGLQQQQQQNHEKKKKSMEETNTLKYVLLYEENSEKWFKIVVEFCYKSKI